MKTDIEKAQTEVRRALRKLWTALHAEGRGVEFHQQVGICIQEDEAAWHCWWEGVYAAMSLNWEGWMEHFARRFHSDSDVPYEHLGRYLGVAFGKLAGAVAAGQRRSREDCAGAPEIGGAR